MKFKIQNFKTCKHLKQSSQNLEKKKKATFNVNYIRLIIFLKKIRHQ